MKYDIEIEELYKELIKKINNTTFDLEKIDYSCMPNYIENEYEASIEFLIHLYNNIEIIIKFK